MAIWRNTSNSYGIVSVCFHWLIALLISAMLALGWGREYAPTTWRPIIMDIHKFTGILILALVFFRIIWKLATPQPELPASLSKFYKLLAHAGHWALYFMMFAMPISGWAMISASGKTVYFLDLIALPPLMQKNLPWRAFLENLHSVMAFMLAGLIVEHIAAALLHHYVFKDDVLRRMLRSKTP